MKRRSKSWLTVRLRRTSDQRKAFYVTLVTDNHYNEDITTEAKAKE